MSSTEQDDNIYVIFCGDGYTRLQPHFSKAIAISHVNNIETTDNMMAGCGCDCGDTGHIIRCYRYDASFVVEHHNKCENCAGSGEVWYAGAQHRTTCSACNGTGEKKK